MKILLLGFAKLKHMPYLNFYLHHLDSGQHSLHLLCWNRDGVTETTPPDIVCHEFSQILHDDLPKLCKLGSFWKYRRFAMRLLGEDFDFIVVMHSMPGVLLQRTLRRRYRGRYIFDYRDYTYEDFAPYRRIIHNLVRFSAAAFVSSDGFRAALPRLEHIFTCHNIPPDAPEHRQRHVRRDHGPIRIGFWGYIRHEGLNRLLITRLAGDPRFQLHYYGAESTVSRKLERYAREVPADNVFFHGSYEPGERDRFARDTDLIHNLYSNTEVPSQRRAMSNKYYDGLMFRLPQLCMKGSFMGHQTVCSGVGLACDPSDEDFAEQIWRYYQRLDRADFDRCCDETLALVLQTNERGRRVIEDAIANVECEK